jgi:asparagine synthase (glutamine-hydrolysing)
MQYADSITYLADDILAKRVPLLDHGVAAVTAAEAFQDARPGKWLLRQILHEYVPKQLVDRPKMGFGVPIDAWRGPLESSWAEDLLDPSAMARAGDLDPTPIQQK